MLKEVEEGFVDLLPLAFIDSRDDDEELLWFVEHTIELLLDELLLSVIQIFKIN